MKTPAKEESPGRPPEIEIPLPPPTTGGPGAATAEELQGGGVLHKLVDLPKSTDAFYLE